MKKFIRLFMMLSIVSCIVLFGFGCGENEVEEEKEGYSIYYLKPDSYSLIYDKKQVDAESVNELVSKLIQEMMNSSDKDKYQSVITSKVKLIDYNVSDNIIYLNFTSDYQNMDRVDELFCRAAFVLTLTQIEEIDFVGMNINGQPLLFKNNTVSLMKASDFTDISQDSVIQNSTTEVTLYFANEAGDKLKSTKVRLNYNSTYTLEKNIIECLIEGPVEDGYYRTIPNNVTVLDAFTRNGVCYVYFDKTLNNSIISVKDEILVYSIVNSLSELTYINKVQIIIDGEFDKKLNDNYPIADAFTRNLDYLEVEARSE